MQCESDEFLKMADRLKVFDEHFQKVREVNQEVMKMSNRSVSTQKEALNYLYQELVELQDLQRQKDAIMRKRLLQKHLTELK